MRQKLKQDVTRLHGLAYINLLLYFLSLNAKIKTLFKAEINRTQLYGMANSGFFPNFSFVA